MNCFHFLKWKFDCCRRGIVYLFHLSYNMRKDAKMSNKVAKFLVRSLTFLRQEWRGKRVREGRNITEG